MISPENLKKLAEHQYPDSTIEIVGNGEVWVDQKFRFNPEENSDQCLELMEKLIKDGQKPEFDIFPFSEDCISLVYGNEKRTMYSGKTINEAVTLAAIAYVEGLENE